MIPSLHCHTVMCIFPLEPFFFLPISSCSCLAFAQILRQSHCMVQIIQHGYLLDSWSKKFRQNASHNECRRWCSWGIWKSKIGWYFERVRPWRNSFFLLSGRKTGEESGALLFWCPKFGFFIGNLYKRSTQTTVSIWTQMVCLNKRNHSLEHAMFNRPAHRSCDELISRNPHCQALLLYLQEATLTKTRLVWRLIFLFVLRFF